MTAVKQFKMKNPGLPSILTANSMQIKCGKADLGNREQVTGER